MKIEDLTDKLRNVNIDVKIIYDQTEAVKMFDKLIKSVIVANVDSAPNDGTPTAILDLYNDDIGKFKHLDKIRVTNAYAKKIPDAAKGKAQFRLVLANKVDKIEP